MKHHRLELKEPTSTKSLEFYTTMPVLGDIENQKQKKGRRMFFFPHAFSQEDLHGTFATLGTTDFLWTLKQFWR